jgi:hypothetical protein
MPFSGVSEPWPSPVLTKLCADLKEGRVISVTVACSAGVVVFAGTAVYDVVDIAKNTVGNVVSVASIATFAVVATAVGTVAAIPMLPIACLVRPRP